MGSGSGYQMIHSEKDLSDYRQDSEPTKDCNVKSFSVWYYFFQGALNLMFQAAFCISHLLKFLFYQAPVFLFLTFIAIAISPAYIICSSVLGIANVGREQVDIDPRKNKHKLEKLTKKIGILRKDNYREFTNGWCWIHIFGVASWVATSIAITILLHG